MAQWLFLSNFWQVVLDFFLFFRIMPSIPEMCTVDRNCDNDRTLPAREWRHDIIPEKKQYLWNILYVSFIFEHKPVVFFCFVFLINLKYLQRMFF